MTATLLIVEDSATQAELLRSILHRAGYESEVAGSGEEALDRLRTGAPFDLVLSDIVMPGIDGFELCSCIKAEPGHATTPVLLLTSLRDPLDVVRALEVGADYFIHKPYDEDQLLSRVDMTLKNHRIRADGRSRMALELSFLGRHFTIDAERQQLLDLLVTTFEDLVVANRRLRANEEQLADAQENLAAQLRAVDLEHRHLATLLDSLPDAVFVTDTNGRITGGNRAVVELTGAEVRQLTGQRLADAVPLVDGTGQLVSASDNPLRRLDASAEERQGLRASVRGGQRLPVSVRTAVVTDQRSQPVAAIAVVRDVSAEAFTDPVTGLPSRVLFLDRVERAVLQSERTGACVAVVVVGVDRLDLVTDTYGPQVRALVLAEIAQRLGGELRDSDTLADLGGNDFGVCREDAEDAGELLRLADRLVGALGEPFAVGDGRVAVRARAGVSVARGGDLDSEALVQQATSAAHQARADGPPCRLYDAALQRRVQHDLELEADLLRAVSRDELVVHYQPELRLPGQQVVGMEALVRWAHPQQGLLPPADFIGVAEDTGAIIPMGRWVLQEACRQTAVWNSALAPHVDPLFVAVNISARQLDDDRLIVHIRDVLEESGLPADRLMLEITESAVMRDPGGARDHLVALKDLGVKLALDDFGTGHSSLAYLRQFPLDVLKIDRAFVEELSRGSGAAIVQAIISLGEAFGLTVIAEGVETEEQRDQLAALGCPLAAGYLFDRPLDIPAFTAMLRDRGMTTSAG